LREIELQLFELSIHITVNNQNQYANHHRFILKIFILMIILDENFSTIKQLNMITSFVTETKCNMEEKINSLKL
jgi:hypothetical protein